MNKAFLYQVTVVLVILSGCVADQTDGGTNNRPAERIVFPAEEFTVSANTDTTIFGIQGTRIFIEKESFQFEDGTPVTGEVKLELKEFYKKSDILLADLSTEAGGRLLETGGMLHITATSDGKAVEIRNDKRIVVHFPKEQGLDKTMNLFYSGKNSTDSSVADWSVDTVNLVKRTLKLGSYGWWYPSNDDSTTYDFKPKNYVDTGYYWNPIDFYVSAYDFSESTKKEVETSMNKNGYSTLQSWNDYGVECEMEISKSGYIRDPKINTRISASAKQEILQFLKGLPQLEPGKNKYGEIIERRGLLFIQGGNVVPLYKTREEYIKSFDKKYAGYENTPIKNMDDAEMNYYVFSVSKLGWINCDRFIESESVTDFVVDVPVSNDTKVKMVFSDIDGVLMAKAIEGKYVFQKVPAGSDVTIFAIKNTNGHFQTAFHEISISETPLNELAFKETTLDELKKELEKFN
ncbi:MAG: hypothetical protein ACOZCO_17925 [Bacteroidota bacterium]